MSPALLRALKRLRVSQPFNAVATSALRALLGGSGLEWGLAVRHLHRVGTTRCRLPNGRTLRLWSRGDDWISNQVFWRGLKGYEPETVPLFFELASSSEVTIDVGAHVGFYTLLAAHANPAGRVFAFEPHPVAHERLLRNVALNGLSHVECVQAAAGARDGNADLFHVPGGLPSSSSLCFDFMKSRGDVDRTRVDVVALDGFLEERRAGRVGLVKIDTEATEPDVLAGLAGRLRRDRPAIVCEVIKGRGAEEGLTAALHTLEYRFFLLTPDGPRSREKIEGDERCLNYLLVPRERNVAGL